MKKYKDEINKEFRYWDCLFSNQGKEIIAKWRSSLPSLHMYGNCNTPEARELRARQKMKFFEILDKYKNYEIAEYEILTYISECSKSSKEIQINNLLLIYDFFEIEKEYVVGIIQSLAEDNYVTGLTYACDPYRGEYFEENNPTITEKGLNYLDKHGCMLRGKKNAKPGFYEKMTDRLNSLSKKNSVIK